MNTTLNKFRSRGFWFQGLRILFKSHPHPRCLLMGRSSPRALSLAHRARQEKNRVVLDLEGKVVLLFKFAYFSNKLPELIFYSLKSWKLSFHSSATPVIVVKKSISELKILGSLRHISLLPLLGFCIEQNQRFLVYEYMPNGNLYDWLHPKEESPENVMEWGVRVKIAIGLARGLAWIHQNCHTVRVIHLDISSKCILLDRNFQPKLSNFGEAMLMSSTCTSSVNSEMWEMAFVKEDVHGFGVVLLELITRVDPRNMTDSSNNVLDEWTDHLLSSSSSYGAIDKSLIGQGFDAEIFQLLKVACRCVDPVPDRRPIMLQVYEDIKAIRERCDLADDSENLMRPEICPATSEISVEIERAEYL